MRTDIISLITRTETRDEYGDPVITETERTVFCEPVSIGQKEFYQAQAVGLQPELKFRLEDELDYNGEQYVRHNDILYRVLRTYRTGQELEITVYREVNPE